MNKPFVCWTAALVVMLLCPACQSADRSNTAKPEERPATVAGSFYPADAAQLTSLVDHALSDAAVPANHDSIIAVISPHAGYQFSGAIAAHSYAQLKGKTFKRVIIIGPAHFESFGSSSVYKGGAYTTPLGRVVVDQEFARKLAGTDRSIRLASAGHSVSEGPEHSIEVQLPFLQRALGDFTIVPIVMGDQSYASSRALGVALARLLKNDNSTLLVASSDLSHYHGYEEASRMDHNLLDAVAQNDLLSLSHNTARRVWEACGAGPILAVMIAAERLGGSSPRILKYANSGDVTGDKSRVVGYGALAIFRGSPDAGVTRFALTEAERAELLKLARLSVEAAVRDRKTYQPSSPSSTSLLQERGVFVTLTSHGQLRGCIGYTSPSYPLYLAVRDVAAFAAVQDPRFPPVRPGELSDLQYEVSVLSPFRHVLDTKNVQVGEHGLVIKRGQEEGVLLPQVPVEQKWDRNTFLQQASLKAGLDSNAWRDDATDVFTFTALVFSDHDSNATRERH
jgi:AmmeMemoRadiSam system protein B/AmmeMemoRadiSam system protein A